MRGPDVGQSAIFLVAGVIFVAAAVGLHYQGRPHEDGVSAVGTVTDFTWRTDTNGRIHYGRVISFPAPGNRMATFDDGSDQGNRQPALGEKVEVSYPAGRPEDAKVVAPHSTGMEWVIRGLFAFALGLITTGLAGIVGPAVRARRRRAAESRP